jgi:putative nucleotidyltransferase with HDIG domain
MKTFNRFMLSFRARVALLFISGMLATALLSNLLIYRLALRSQFEQLRRQLVMVARTAALSIDAGQLMRIPLSREGIRSPEFTAVAQRLYAIKKANPQIRYIYTMTTTGMNGIWQFIVDPVAPTTEERKKHLVSYPGTPYNASRFPEMMKSFGDAQADRKLTVDEWGPMLSGYAPIRDASGTAVAILGVDVAADEVYAMQREIHLRALYVLLLSIVLSLFMSSLISDRVSLPVQRLVEGTRMIAREQFKRIRVDGSREIQELAESFNDMSDRLHRSRRKLNTYFYRVIHSLIKIMEARDPYTKGHSERVADYAARIALRLKLPPGEVELLRETAVLHDIGKLGVEERILNKAERLTEDEWRTVKRHPAMGEEILAPLLLNKELVSIVRSHHERFDGTGYPDKLSGNGIKLFAQILAVADAFDAMTSPRSYRPAMEQQRALEELLSNRGTQFAPRIVDAFVGMIREEAHGKA